MEIAVIGANGKEGKLIVEEAVNRGIDVTAVVRHANNSTAQKALNKDVFDLTADDVKGFDVIVDAVGAWTPDTVHVIPDATKHLCGLLKGTRKRLLVVGGAGSLFVDSEHTKTAVEANPFPDAAMPILNAHQEALDFLRTQNDVNWTYVSPALDFVADGKKTGEYKLAGEELTLNSEGKSTISYADYALAMVDEIESGKHIKERISGVSK